MASLNSCQEYSPAEALHTSQDERSFGTHAARGADALSEGFWLPGMSEPY